MFVKQHGSGADRYLCLHGWTGDYRTFDPMLPYLPESARLYAADLPGCGLSEAPERWELESVANEIGAVMEEVGAPLTIVGNCIGGLIGMTAAMARPGLLRRLVLIDAFATWPWYFRIFTEPGWGRYAYLTTFANPVGRRITNGALSSKRSHQSDLTAGFAGGRHETALRYLQMVRGLKSADVFAPLRVPVDVIYGARSFRAVRESVHIWRGMWPWARVWELKGAGHLPIRESAAELSEIIFEGGECLQEFESISNAGVR